MKYKMMILTVSVLMMVIAAQAEPLTFTITDSEDNLVRFESKAPLETIVGKTSEISGSMTFDPNDLSSGITAVVVVDAASLKTGNGIRDGHMRDNHLHTEEHPNIQFKMDNVELAGQLTAGSSVKTSARGEFSLHGVTKTIDVPVEVTLSEQGSSKQVHVIANFQVKLSEYGIPRPQFLIMKLDEVQNITVEFRGVTQ